MEFFKYGDLATPFTIEFIIAQFLVRQKGSLSIFTSIELATPLGTFTVGSSHSYRKLLFFSSNLIVMPF